MGYNCKDSPILAKRNLVRSPETARKDVKTDSSSNMSKKRRIVGHSKVWGNPLLAKRNSVEDVELKNLETSQPSLSNRYVKMLADYDDFRGENRYYRNIYFNCSKLPAVVIIEEEEADDDIESGYESDRELGDEVAEDSGDGNDIVNKYVSFYTLCTSKDSKCGSQETPVVKYFELSRLNGYSCKNSSLSVVLKSSTEDTKKAPCFAYSDYSETVSSEAFETVPYSCRDNGADDTRCIAASDALKNNNDDDDDDSSEIRDPDIDSDAAEDTDETSPVHSSQEHGTTETNDMATYTSTTTATTGTNTLSVTVTPSAPSEIVEMILLSSSRMVASGLWKANNEQAVANTYRLLATVCHDWWSLLRQRFFQRSLRSALRSIDPFVFYRRKASFVQQLSSDLDVNALTVCDNRVFLTGISSSTIEVFDAESCLQLQTLTVDAMIDPWDIAAHPASRYLYVFEGLYEVLRLDLSGRLVGSWVLDGSQCALSVSPVNSVVITYSDRLEECDNVGQILRSIRLDRTICAASHSLSLNANRFVVCHGSGSCLVPHLVCIVDSQGRILERHQGSGDSMYQPLHLAVADHGCVLAVDVNNRTVQILSEKLSHSYDLINTRRHHPWPLKVCYDSARGNVFISTIDGTVLVYCVRTRTSVQTECLDVHSGLIPGQLTDVEYDSMDTVMTRETEE